MRRAAWVAALLLSGIGCDDGGGLFAPDAAVVGCAERCPGDLACEHGACVGERGPPWPVTLRLRPRVDAPLAPAEVSAFDAPAAVNPLPDLPLPLGTPLVGRALLVGGQEGPIPIRVRASAQATQSIDAQSLTATGELLERADGPRFVLQLAPFWPTAEGNRRGTVYRLTLRPEDAERYPPWVVDDVRVGLGGSQIDVELPAAEPLPTVLGNVFISAENSNPIAGLRVFAVDASGRRVSTDTVTDAAGGFALRFWPGGDPAVTLRVRRAGEVGPVPEIDRPITVPEPGAEPSYVRIYLGELPRTFDLTGQIIDDAGEPVAGVVVRMRGAVGEGIFGVDAGPTGADGIFQATMYPARYRVDLEPPADTSARLARLETVIDADSAPRWTLGPGTTIRGTLHGPAGAPLARARLEARLLSARYADPALVVPGEVPPARTRQTESDAAGQFVMQLDPGEHLVRVVPPAESGLPESDHPLTVPIGGGLPPVVFQVPAAAAVTFVLRDADGLPAPDVVVEAWRTDHDPPVRVGETVSGPDGAGVVRIPVVD